MFKKTPMSEVCLRRYFHVYTTHKSKTRFVQSFTFQQYL